MTRTRTLFVALMLAGASTALIGRQASPAAALFQQGLLLERAEGNVAQAIVLFERVVADYPKDPGVPQVIAHLAQLYERRNDPRANQMWARLTLNYGSSPYAAEARRKQQLSQNQVTGPFRAKALESIDQTGPVSFSPDGRSLVTRKGDQEELLFRNLDTGQERKIVVEKGRLVLQPQWSPDSRRLAFTTRASVIGNQTANNLPHDVRIVTVQNGQVRTVASAEAGQTGFHWSPNSRWLVMQVGAVPAGPNVAGDIRLVDAMTGEFRKLSGPSIPTDWFVWSPDSRQVIFQTAEYAVPPAQPKDSYWLASVETGEVKPWTMPLDPSKGRVNLATGVTRRWTPDGRVLVRQVPARGASAGARGGGEGAGAAPAGGNTVFYLVPVTGGPAQPSCTVAPPIQCMPHITPDGKIRLASDSTTKRLVLFDSSKGAAAPLKLTEGFAEENSPRLSSDGRTLLFASNPDGEWALYAMPLDKTPVASPVRVTTLGAASAGYEAWTADGRLVLNLWYDDNDIYRINMDRNGRSVGSAGRLTQNLRFNAVPSIGPESKTVAFHYNDGIAVMTADGAGERPVLQTLTSGHVEWQSADQVIFQRRGEAGAKTTALASLNVNTGAVQPLFDLPLIGMNHWQFVPSRNEVFYVPTETANGASNLRARSIATGTDRVVATIQDMLLFRFSFRVSPDGKQIAYGTWVGTGDARRPEMHVMTIDGKDSRALPTTKEPSRGWRPSGYPYDWSPDGRFLLYDGFPGRLMVMDVRSGESWPIPQATDSDNGEWAGAQWAPDGSFIAIERYGYRQEWRMFDGLTYDNVVKLMNGKK